MSSDQAIRVSGLSKCYQIYEQPQHRLLQGLFRGRKQFFHEFWALRDVSFTVKKGETVGIIGRNGSGKSTLLQLICRTLQPTSGTVEFEGRVAALLELGAGFNPEFTGKENVYMNASVLGLSQEEITARYADIVTFADIGDFIDQPVKTYSSGMFVRLAFAVVAHVDADILVVDEALSVGDIAFQNKCMACLRRMTERGATILFVSHDLSTTQTICDRVVWLDGGRVARIGDPVQVSREYYIASLGKLAEEIPENHIIQQQETGSARYTEVTVVNWSPEKTPRFKVGDRITIRFTLLALADLEPMVNAISVYRSDGDWLIGQTSRDNGMVSWPATRKGNTVKGEIILDPVSLAPGEYLIALAAYSTDYQICHGLTDRLPGFTVYADYPTWGKFIHPIEWRPLPDSAQ